MIFMAYSDKEKKKAWYRQAYAKNPEPQKEANRKRRDWRRQILLEQVGHVCCICGSEERIEFDHINPSLKKDRVSPLSMGLERIKQEIPNLRAMCHKCHVKRSTAQKKAAWDLFKELDLDKQNELIQAYLN